MKCIAAWVFPALVDIEAYASGFFCRVLLCDVTYSISIISYNYVRLGYLIYLGCWISQVIHSINLSDDEVLLSLILSIYLVLSFMEDMSPGSLVIYIILVIEWMHHVFQGNKTDNSNTMLIFIFSVACIDP